MDPAAQGITYPPVSFVVDPDRVARFAEVVGQRSPGVPPTFMTAAEFTVFPQIIGDPRLALDFTRVVHGTEEYVYTRALVPGESLEVTPSIESVKVRGGAGFLTILLEARDPAGALVATARAMMIERGPDT